MTDYRYRCKGKHCKVSPCPACHNHGPCRHCHNGARRRGCKNLIVYEAKDEEEQQRSHPTQAKLVGEPPLIGAMKGRYAVRESVIREARR